VFEADKLGISLAILAGAIGSFGLIGFYFLLTRKEASIAVPLTAVYPALTAILAFVFLKEPLTPVKIAGISLSAVALYLLSL
jgi:transporter family protein